MGTGVFRYDRNQLIDLLQHDALKRGTFTLASGRISHYYVDGRKVTLSAQGAALVGAGVIDQLTIRPEITAVGGLTMGADPIVGATLALAAEAGLGHLRGFLVRKETKTHGTGNLIEGPLEPGSTVAILDDVATTGGSSLQAGAGCRSDRLQGGRRDRCPRPDGRSSQGIRCPWSPLPSALDDPGPRRGAIASGRHLNLGQGMETSLHRTLKERYAVGGSGRPEIVVDGFRVDAVDQAGRLIEVQSGALGPLCAKLRRLLPEYRIRIVKPVVLKRRVIRKSKPTGPVLGRGRARSAVSFSTSSMI